MDKHAAEVLAQGQIRKDRRLKLEADFVRDQATEHHSQRKVGMPLFET
jgi:hypothetical protein